MAGGTWPIVLFHRGRSVQGPSQKAWPKSPHNPRTPTEFSRNRSEPQQPCKSYHGISARLYASASVVFLCSCTSEEWIVQSTLLPTLVIFDVFLKAWALKAHKTQDFIFILSYCICVLLMCFSLCSWKTGGNMTWVPKSSETRQKRCPQLLVCEMLWFLSCCHDFGWLRM